MADALAYADEHLDPDVLLDIATLTGAARIALARVMAPLFATDDALADALARAGEASGETVWRMPLADDYRRALDSDVADLTHIADGVGGGAVTAALFLREFVGQRRWAHLDIAGTGRSDVECRCQRQGWHRVRDEVAAAVAGGDTMNAGYGLTVRWSLEGAPEGVAEQLRDVRRRHLASRASSFLDGLAFKTWRMREGEWFEGTYVFDSEEERRGFRADFEPGRPRHRAAR